METINSTFVDRTSGRELHRRRPSNDPPGQITTANQVSIAQGERHHQARGFYDQEFSIWRSAGERENEENR